MSKIPRTEWYFPHCLQISSSLLLLLSCDVTRVRNDGLVELVLFCTTSICHWVLLLFSWLIIIISFYSENDMSGLNVAADIEIRFVGVCLQVVQQVDFTASSLTTKIHALFDVNVNERIIMSNTFWVPSKIKNQSKSNVILLLMNNDNVCN